MHRKNLGAKGFYTSHISPMSNRFWQVVGLAATACILLAAPGYSEDDPNAPSTGGATVYQAAMTEVGNALITFSEVPEGTYITDQYTNMGIIFGGDSPFTAPDRSHPAPPVLSGTPLFEGAIEGYFINSDGGYAIDAYGFSLDAGSFSQIGSTRLEWFDLGNNKLGEMYNSTTGIEHLVVSGGGIAKWRISMATPDDYGFAIDSVSIDWGSLPELTKTDGIDPNVASCVGEGTTLTYTIAFDWANEPNHTTIHDVNIVDVLPAGVIYNSSSPEGDYRPLEHSVRWQLGTLTPGSTGSVSVTVLVNDLAYVDMVLHNVATLYCDAGQTTVVKDTPVCCPPGNIVYVRADAPDRGNGISWATAFNDLHKALLRAETCSMQVWVAQGTYSPGSDPTKSFTVPDGVSVFGGFMGYEPADFDLDQRNLDMVKTVLDGTISEFQSNSVVVAMGDGSLLNGFVVRGAALRGIAGQTVNFSVEKCEVANNTLNGIDAKNGNLTVKWCTVADNGENGVYAYADTSYLPTTTIANSRILRNGQNGVYTKRGTPIIKNSVIVGNGYPNGVPWGDLYAGLKFESPAGRPIVRNCTIVENGECAVRRVEDLSVWPIPEPTSPDVRNCILWGNRWSPSGYARQYEGGMGVFYSCVMGQTEDPNGCIHLDPKLISPDANSPLSWHLWSDSLCKNAGYISSTLYVDENDIDGQSRVFDGQVDMGADEVTCEDVNNPLDWNHDGLVNLTEFAVMARAWKSTPQDPNWWDARVNLYADSTIDLKDLRYLCEGYQGYAGYVWVACWHPPIPPIPAPPLLSPPFGAEPNEPYYDPNEPYDPNDFFGMMSMGVMELQSSSTWEPVSESGLTIAQLEEIIAFLTDNVLTEPALTQEETDNIVEFLQGLQQELDVLYESQTPGFYSR